LNYKKDSKEAAEILDNLPELIINILNKYGYARTRDYYYNGIRALFNRVHLENNVIKLLQSKSDIKDVKQVSHDIDRKENYDLISSIGKIDVKSHLYGNKNFTLPKKEVKGADWYCFVDMDLSDVTKFKEKFSQAKLYIVNANKIIDNENIKGISKSTTDYILFTVNNIKEIADYII